MICFINVVVNGNNMIAIEQNGELNIDRFSVEEIIKLNEGSFIVMCVPGGKTELSLYRLMFLNEKVESHLVGYYKHQFSDNKFEKRNELYNPVGRLAQFIKANKDKPIQGTTDVNVSFGSFENLSINSDDILSALWSIDGELTEAVKLIKKMKMY